MVARFECLVRRNDCTRLTLDGRRSGDANCCGLGGLPLRHTGSSARRRWTTTSVCAIRAARITTGGACRDWPALKPPDSCRPGSPERRVATNFPATRHRRGKWHCRCAVQ
jgi:hypothetical protein